MAHDSAETGLAVRLQRLGRALRYLERQTLEPYGVTPEQFRILLRLTERDGRGQSELVDPVFDDRANLTHLVNQLQRRRLVERRPDEADGRRRRVWLTPTGRTLAARLVDDVRQSRDAVLAALDEEEHDVLVGIVERLERQLPLAASSGRR